MGVQKCFTTYKFIKNAWLSQGHTARRGGGAAVPIRPWTWFCHKIGDFSTIVLTYNNDNDNDNEIDLFRHHNGNNTNIKVIFKQVTMLDKCNCI